MKAWKDEYDEWHYCACKRNFLATGNGKIPVWDRERRPEYDAHQP